MLGGKSSKSPGGLPLQSPVAQWDNIIKFLDSLMSRMRVNHVWYLLICLSLSDLRYFFQSSLCKHLFGQWDKRCNGFLIWTLVIKTKLNQLGICLPSCSKEPQSCYVKEWNKNW